ncbi:PhnA domain-containing protein [Aureibacter tunicatorum]|uniref:Protein PhnA n=1 Tax=Aureibacter tunicatorum TaxID=866807 RepID=A0AAE4BV24_9BACT|nr:PhnA domain-containing protein [Aureibacter tunicatorum]MDR6241645.1 protein PhnA [Aureibacter tunicatorum]BDD07368.1 PhnA protein [Aureibacter tunicatorum]
MKIEKALQDRSGSKCEICGSKDNLSIFTVAPATDASEKDSVYICETCSSQINHPDKMDSNHWRCLNDSMWSEVPAVQIISWRMLHKLKKEGWPQDLLDMMYLDENMQKWAESTGDHLDESENPKHRDSNGVELKAGDSVVLIKDLNVKGSSLVAKRGTAVRNISLDHDNHEYIEGKVDGQQIVILTKYVKKNK